MGRRSSQITMTRSICSRISTCWLLAWSFSTAFVTPPKHQRFSRENDAPNSILGFNHYGADALDMTCITAMESSKRGIKTVTAEAQKGIEGFLKVLENTESKVVYIETVAVKLRRHIRSLSEEAVSDAKRLKRKAIDDMETLTDQNVAFVVETTNSTERSLHVATVLQQMDATKAKALEDIEAIAAQLDKDAEAVAETFELLMKAIH
jgi:hypothetical protein